MTTIFDGAAAVAYVEPLLGSRDVSGGFTDDFEAQDPQPGPNEHRYTTEMLLQIADVSAIQPTSLPAGCTDSYDDAFRIDYVPRTVTFSQEIDGTMYTYRGTVGTEPLQVGVNLTPDPDDDSPVLFLDWCAAVGSVVVTDENSAFGNAALVLLSPSWVNSTAGISPFLPLYTIDFDPQGGSAVNSAEVLEGDATTAPDDPTRDTYSFVGWFTEPDGGTAWDFTAPVMGDMTLYAQWSINSYTVSFDSQQGSAVDNATVDHGDAASAPDDPTREGYTFAGWFTEQSGVELWDFATPITADTTLYAQWEAVPAEETEQPEQSQQPEASQEPEQSEQQQQSEQSQQSQQSEQPTGQEEADPTGQEEREQLSATGFNAGPWSLAGLGLLIAGAGAVLFPWMRRRSSGRPGRGLASGPGPGSA